jgi:Uma2 family endonuclease
MSTAMLPPPADPVHRFTVDQYDRMIEAGILSEKDKVVLIHGVIRLKMPKGDDHETAMEALLKLLAALVPATFSLRCQSPIRLSDSVPEPDFVICTTTKERRGKHPRAADTFLVIEVADSSLDLDRTEMLELYASAGILEYWIVNLVDRQIEVYTKPVNPKRGPATYQSRTTFPAGKTVPLVTRSRALGTIPVDDLLP